MIKKTFKELKQIDTIYARLLEVPETNFVKTKLGYAFKRFSEKNLVDIFTEFQDEQQDARIEYALTDEKTKALLYKTDGNFQNSKEGLRDLIKKLREITKEWGTKQFDVEPFICNDISGVELSDEDKEALDGVIINIAKE